MLSFYLILIGMYLYYSKSKYFPKDIIRADFPGAGWIGLLFLISGTTGYIWSDGWAGGLILALVCGSLALGAVQFFAVMGRSYFYALLAIVHGLVIIELISYAG
jgi:hypothetical protein